MPRKDIQDSKIITAGGPPVEKQPAPRTVRSSEIRSGNHRLLQMPRRVDGDGPQDPKPTPLSGCTPVRYRIEDFRANIIAAARSGRHYRSIAAQYGLNALEVWEIVTGELATKRRAA